MSEIESLKFDIIKIAGPGIGIEIEDWRLRRFTSRGFSEKDESELTGAVVG